MSLEPHEAQQPDPYPVEVHRIERQPVDAAPWGMAPSIAAEAAGEYAVEEPAAPGPPPDAASERHAEEPAAIAPAMEPAGEHTVEEPAAIEPAAADVASERRAEEPAATEPADDAASERRAEEPAAIEPAPEPVSAPAVAEAVGMPPSTTRPVAQTMSAPPPPPELPVAGKGSSELRITEAVPEPNLASGRWEEFNEFPRSELRHGRGVKLDSRPPVPLSGWGGDAEYEPQRRSVLRIALPVLAVLIAVGAVLCVGYLRDRLNQQDSVVSSLKEQNRKLAESLVSVSSANEGATPSSSAHGQPGSPQPKSPAPSAENAPAVAKAPAPASPSNNAPASEKAEAPAITPQQAPQGSQQARQGSQQAPQGGKLREGVSTPPPQSSVVRRDSRRPVDANYHPEIVPPYPTLSQSQNVASATGNAAPTQQTFRQPSIASPSRSALASSTTASAGAATPPSLGTSQGARLAQPAQSSDAQDSNAFYTATSNGMYASALAQNIEAVESLQRQSSVPLREFHARQGAAAKVTPGVTVSVQSPDPARGTYALVVNSAGTSYQLHGRVDSPLTFTDNASHRVYALVVLRIIGGEAYGYVRAVQQ